MLLSESVCCGLFSLSSAPEHLWCPVSECSWRPAGSHSCIIWVFYKEWTMQCGCRRPWEIPVGYGSLLCTHQGEHQEIQLQWLCWFKMPWVCVSVVFTVYIACAWRDPCWSRRFYVVTICTSMAFWVQFCSLVFGGGQTKIKTTETGTGKAIRITREWEATVERKLDESNLFHLAKWRSEGDTMNVYKYTGDISREKVT